MAAASLDLAAVVWRFQSRWSAAVGRFHYKSAILAASLCVLLQAAPASAHPHVLVDARAEVVFDTSGRIGAIRNIWQFDEAFTAFAIQGLDTDNDGKLSDAELAPLAKVNVDSLAEFDFFTKLVIGKTRSIMVQPTEYWLEFHDSRLTLFFSLPLQSPVSLSGRATLEVFDPEYFVAFTFMKVDPVRLEGAPEGCRAAYHPPRALDAETTSALAAIPRSERELPPDLASAAASLINLITIDCPGTVAGPSTAAEAVQEMAAAAPPAPAPESLAAKAEDSPFFSLPMLVAGLAAIAIIGGGVFFLRRGRNPR
jgi:ABC-type uncharacterized transport system substrate-binding protein